MPIERRVTSQEEAEAIAKQEGLQFLGIRWLNDIGIAYYNPTPAIAKPGVSYEEALEVLEYETLLNYWWMFFDALAAAKYRYPYKEQICDYSPGTGIVCLKSEEVPRGETRWVSSIAAIAYGCAPDSIELTVEYLANVLGIVRKVSPGQDKDVAMLGSMILTEGMYAQACFANVSACEKICLVLNGGLAQGFDPAFVLSKIVMREEEEIRCIAWALEDTFLSPSGAVWHDCVSDGTYIYNVKYGQLFYRREDLSTGTVTTYPLPEITSYSIAFDGTYIWVVTYPTGTWDFNLRRYTLGGVEVDSRIINIGDHFTMSYDVDRNVMWFGMVNSGTILKINPYTATVLDTLTGTGTDNDWGIIYHNDLLYRNNRNTGDFSVIDLNGNLVETHVGVAPWFDRGMCRHKKDMYISAQSDANVARVCMEGIF